MVWPDDTLGDVLAELKKGRTHLAVVRDVNNTNDTQDPFYEVKGIITLEGMYPMRDAHCLFEFCRPPVPILCCRRYY